MIKENIKAI